MGEQIALDSASLLAAASERTGGLSDLGSESIHDRLEILIEMLEGARLTPEGRRAAHEAVTSVLATRLRLPFVDADAEIELAAGCSIPEFFARYGEAAFRDGERRVIARLLRDPPNV